MTVIGLMSTVGAGLGDIFVTTVGVLGWVISFRAFVQASCNDAASTRWAGLWPKVDE